ncbi:MAG: YwqJ-related putative deaminase, partial [Kangiellaceae bacterium]|nr:YwqJ-related putative deaminase [Kangiellaceae bacterium]
IVDSPTKVDSNGDLEYTRSVTDFHQKFPKAGKVEAIRTCKASNDDEYCDGDKLSSRTVTYHEKTTASDSLYWIVAKDDTSITYPLAGGTKELSRSETSIAYADLDIYGNISKVVSQINNGFSTVKVTKEFDFDTTDTSWRNKLDYNTVQYETVTGSAVHETSLDPIKKVKTSYTWTDERLPDLVTTEPLLPANDSGKKVVVDTDYNVYGLPTEVSTYESGNLNDARKVSTTYSDDGSSVAADGYFVYEVTNAEDHNVKTTTDPSHGQALSVTQNGLTSWTDYDVFGRAEEITPPTDTGQPTYIRFADCNNGCDGINDSNIRYKTTSYQVGAPTTVAYKDKFNRVIYSKLEKFDGTASYNKVVYNRLGQKTFESVPSSATDETKGVSFEAYDLLGRLTSKTVSQPYDQSMVVAYSYVDNTTNIEVTGLEKTLTMSRTYGSDGKLIKTTQNDGTQDIVTQYAYDAMSNPIVLQDANGNAIRAKYNAMGQKDYVDDPNMGTKNFTYTEFGELLSETDANGNTYYFVYDDLGRLTYRYLNLLPTDTNQDMAEASFSYDAQCEGALDSEARLDLSGSESFSKTYSYDAWCRSSDVTTNIDGTEFKTSTVYDGNYGRVKGVLYPNKLLSETIYNSRGYATKTQNPLTNYVYHEVTSMDARGLVLTANKANGILNEGFEYWDETGQMKLVYAQTTNGASQRHRIEYIYDSFGNLKTQTTESMRSSLVSSIETYTYDKLHRLTKSARTVDGVPLNDINYDYDKVGNIKFKDDYANNYLYGDANKSSGNAGPNAIYSINKIGEGTKTFGYDNNGNLKNGDGKLISYNAFNKPVSISRNGITSRFYYGADQMRYKQVKEGRANGDEVTLYIDKVFEVISYNGETQKKLYLGDAIITETSSGGQTAHKMSFVHRDRLGSVVTITDENGDVVDNKSFDPFGKPRKGTMEDVDPPTLRDVAYADGFISTLDDLKLETRRGFTDHEHLDDAQLIHMNGRVYDYNLGRFLSVDPFIQEPGNSQSMNPYSYIMNNPLAGTDPSGYLAVLIPYIVKGGGYALAAWGAVETAEVVGETVAKYQLDELTATDAAITATAAAGEAFLMKRLKIVENLADAAGTGLKKLKDKLTSVETNNGQQPMKNTGESSTLGAKAEEAVDNARASGKGYGNKGGAAGAAEVPDETARITGKKYYQGASKDIKPEEAHPVVREVYAEIPDQKGMRGAGHGRCAEASMCTQILGDVEKATGKEITTVEQAKKYLSGTKMDVRNTKNNAVKEPKEACKSCAPTQDKLGIIDVNREK